MVLARNRYITELVVLTGISLAIPIIAAALLLSWIPFIYNLGLSEMMDLGILILMPSILINVIYSVIRQRTLRIQIILAFLIVVYALPWIWIVRDTGFVEYYAYGLLILPWALVTVPCVVICCILNTIEWFQAKTDHAINAVLLLISLAIVIRWSMAIYYAISHMTRPL